jgi:hypothetical protein
MYLSPFLVLVVEHVALFACHKSEEKFNDLRLLAIFRITNQASLSWTLFSYHSLLWQFAMEMKHDVEHFESLFQKFSWLEVFYFLQFIYSTMFADPFSMAPQKALETIGKTLSIQYERWQPKVRTFFACTCLTYCFICAF